jgi:hypothetical protein
MTRGVGRLFDGDVGGALAESGSVLLVLGAVALFLFVRRATIRVPRGHRPGAGGDVVLPAHRSQPAARSGADAEEPTHVDGTAPAAAPPPPRLPASWSGRPTSCRPAAQRELSAGDAIGYGWNVYWKNVGTLIVIALVVFAINVVVSLVGTALGGGVVVQAIVQFVGFLVGMLLSLGWLRIARDHARREARGRRPVQGAGVRPLLARVDPVCDRLLHRADPADRAGHHLRLRVRLLWLRDR